jgi:penicillin-binding protein A
MNPRIGTLFKLCAGACLVLISFTAYWQIWAASGLAARQDNARLVYRQLQIKRGLILAANGHTVLATNTERTKDGLNVFLRRYPLGPLFGHPIGYNTVGSGRSGLELSQNDYLTASNADLSTVLGRIGDKLQGETVTGNNVVTSLSVPAQRAAMLGLT